MTGQRTSSRAGAGSASGHVANRARGTVAAAVEPDRVVAALRQVAEDLGVRVGALRMIDYRHALTAEFEGPTLAEVMATFGTWRNARRAATGSGSASVAP